MKYLALLAVLGIFTSACFADCSESCGFASRVRSSAQARASCGGIAPVARAVSAVREVRSARFAARAADCGGYEAQASCSGN